MSTFHRVSGFVLVTVMGIAATMVTGCSQPVQQTEGRGSTSSKLLAPKPTLTAKASSATKSAYGISTWKLFRGKHDVFVTGYDSKGRAVKGLSAGIRNDENQEATLITAVHDGSKFKSSHSFVSHKTTATTQLTDPSHAFVAQAFSDLARLRKGLTAKSTATTSTSHVAHVATCNADMTSVVLAALQCIQANGGNSALASQCVAAAESASTAGTCTASTSSSSATGSTTGSTASDDGDMFDDPDEIDLDDVDDDGLGGLDDDDDDDDDTDFGVDGSDPFGTGGDCLSCDGDDDDDEDDLDADDDDGDVGDFDGGGDSAFASFKHVTMAPANKK